MASKKSYSTISLACSTMGSILVGLIFCSILIFSFGALENRAWQWVIQIISVLLFIGICYSPSWYCGDHDKNAVQFGRMERDPLKGLKIGLIAMIPFALTWLLPVFCKLGVLPGSETFDMGMAVYRIINVHMLYLINLLLPPEMRAAALPWSGILGVFSFYLLIPLTTFVAYYFGYRQISLSERLIFKNSRHKRKLR